MGVALKRPGCFLIGSGSSLNKVDVARLCHVDTISFNRSYVAWERWGFAPTMYACLDFAAFENSAEDIRALIEEHLETRFFLPDGAAAFGIVSSARVRHLRLLPGHTFSGDSHALTDFGNVGATAIQILAILGYRRITLVGVDARYKPVEETVVVDEDGFMRLVDDPNHFYAGYVRRKKLGPRHDLAKVLGQWPNVASECERVGMEVRNASPGSALDCFPATDFDSAIEWTLNG